MKRINNAPPPLTPWRAEVLEAQKQLEAKGAPRHSRSRSRSRSRGRRRGNAGNSGAQVAAASSSSSAKGSERTAAPSGGKGATGTGTRAPEAGVVLRQARERGEGWYAAVARAAESWESVKSQRRPPVPGKGGKGGEEAGVQDKQLRQDGKKKGKEGDKPRRDEEADRQREEELEKAREEAERNELEKQRLEYEARAEERQQKAELDRKVAEKERKKLEELKKQRKQKLKGAFAVGEDDEDEDNEAEQVRKATERKRHEITEAIVRAPRREAPPPSTLALPGTSKDSKQEIVDPSLSEKLRFEPGLNPAEAFMRLQERKRKGRRSEFGGPPRGCSPWRDGKRGVSWKEGDE